MLSRISRVVVTVALTAAHFAAAVPLKHSARTLRPATSEAASSVAFQAAGIDGDLALVGPAALLSISGHTAPDGGSFKNVSFLTGLAIDATNRVFVVGNDGANSFLGRVDLGSGAVTSIGTIHGEIVVDLTFDGAGNLYALTADNDGSDPHALLSINPDTAAASVVKSLSSHGANSGSDYYGAIAWNPADQHLYYSDTVGTFGFGSLFVDQLAPSTFVQTTVLSGGPTISEPTAMGFAAGRLWIFTEFDTYSAPASAIGTGLTDEGSPSFLTPDGTFQFPTQGVAPPPTTLTCIPSPTAVCLANRFKVEVTYDATPTNGTGPGKVVLESNETVKFTFFDPTNIEMFLKVLNACVPPFNHWWVFGGGLTTVGVEVKVTDTMTGAVKMYTSTKNNLFQPFADTSAFSCP